MFRRSAHVLAVLAFGVAVLTGACAPSESSPDDVTVGGLDYAFQAPDTLPPGPTVFHFENRGEVRHEMVLVRLKEGVTMQQLMEGVQSGSEPGEFIEGGPGILLAQPGQTTAAGLLVDLVPGRTYALVCNLRDTPDAQPHAALGMRDSFVVREATG